MATTREAVPALRAEPSEALYTKLSPGPGKPSAEVAAHQRARIHRAMIELVAERGYDAVTVRELAARAGVSTRAFYEHFSSKEDCFLRVHELIVRRAARRVVTSQAGECDWRQRLRLAFNAFTRELEREPQAARLSLVEAYASGPVAREQVRRAECTFEAMIAESFANAPGEIEMSPILIKGMVSGVVSVTRSRLLAGYDEDQLQHADELLKWALSYRDKCVEELTDLDCQAVSPDPAVGIRLTPSSTESMGSRASTSDRALILSAVTRLVAENGYENLTTARIRTTAGISCKRFDANFDGVEDCLIAAFELQASEVLTHAARAQASGLTWAGGIYQALTRVCAQIACDPGLANLCFSGISAPRMSGMMHCHQRILADIDALISNGAPYPSHELTLEASVGAALGVLQHYVATGRSQQTLSITGTLSYLALAPAVGAGAAADAIRTELACA